MLGVASLSDVVLLLRNFVALRAKNSIAAPAAAPAAIDKAAIGWARVAWNIVGADRNAPALTAAAALANSANFLEYGFLADVER